MHRKQGSKQKLFSGRNLPAEGRVTAAVQSVYRDIVPRYCKRSRRAPAAWSDNFLTASQVPTSK